MSFHRGKNVLKQRLERLGAVFAAGEGLWDRDHSWGCSGSTAARHGEAWLDWDFRAATTLKAEGGCAHGGGRLRKQFWAAIRQAQIVCIISRQQMEEHLQLAQELAGRGSTIRQHSGCKERHASHVWKCLSNKREQ